VDGDFGPVFTEYEGDPEGAIERLLREKTGEARAVVTREGLGAIDLIYGNEKGGLAHIAAEHPGILPRLPTILREGELKEIPGNRKKYLITDKTIPEVAVVSLDYNGKEKTWVVTAYEDVQGTVSGRAKTMNSGRNDSEGGHSLPNRKPDPTIAPSTPSENTPAEDGTAPTDNKSAAKPVAERDADLLSGPEDNKYSFSPPVRNPETSAGVRASIEKALGKKVVDRLTASGKLVIHETPDTLPDDLKRGVSRAGRASGLYDKRTKTIHLIAAYIRKGDGAAKSGHEGLHIFLDALEHRDSEAHKRLMKRLAAIEKMAKSPLGKGGKAREWFELALDRIPEADRTNDAVRLNELAAYAIEEYERAPRSLPQAMLKWVEDFIASIRTALMRHGFTPKNLTAADLSAISRRFLRQQARSVSRNSNKDRSGSQNPENETQTFPEGEALASRFSVENSSRTIEPVRLNLEGWNGSMTELKKLAMAEYAKLQGKSFHNDDMNVDVAFTSEGKGVAFQTSGNTRAGWRAEMVRVLPKLVRRAVKIGEAKPDARRAGDTRMFHTLVAPLAVNNRVYSAKITLRESLPKDVGVRHKFYDIAALEIGNDVAVSGLPSENTERIHPTPTTPSPVSVGDLAAAINRDDIRFSVEPPSSMMRRAQEDMIKFFGKRRIGTFNFFHKRLSTQYHKALIDPEHYGKVFNNVCAMMNEVSLSAIRPAELAPGVLPRVDDAKSAWRTLREGRRAATDLAQAAEAIFAGTLVVPDNPTAGKVWTDKELQEMGLNETGIALYRQTRAAIDASLDELAAAEAYAVAQDIVPKRLRQSIIDDPRSAEDQLMTALNRQIKLLDVAINGAKRRGDEQQQNEQEAIRKQYIETRRIVEKVFKTAKNLKAAGYAPLMRHGKYTVTVQQIDPATGSALLDEDGRPLIEYFGKFETEGEAVAMHRKMIEKYKGRNDIYIPEEVEVASSLANDLYAGISPETVALFGDAIGAKEATQKYYELALSERSALKRRLKRKGTAGYSENVARVLSNFITSNARFAAQRYYLRDLNRSIQNIPKGKGDVQDEALLLKKFILDPNDPAAPISSLMFIWHLGGSFMAAVTNMTQPVMMTAPFLSQYGVGNATSALAKALPYAMGKKQITDNDLRTALKRASREGIVDAQEIFHLYSVGAQGVATGLVNTLERIPGVGKKIKTESEDWRARAGAFMTLWGSMFALAEGFNRKLTFIAAWEVAKIKGLDPYELAVRAVNETQGIYNKANRPNWARNPVGRVILTFKQFSIMYLEMAWRMLRYGGPEGRKAVLIMLAVMVLAAGAEGIPFVQDVDDIIDTIGQKFFDSDTNMRRNKREWAYGILGKEFGDLVLYGGSTQLPLDFSGRLGMGNMIPGSGLLKPSDKDFQTRNILEILGASTGLGGQFIDFYEADGYAKKMENLAPKAIRDAIAGGKIIKKGYAEDVKGRKVVDANPLDGFFKGIGFNPTVVAQQHRKTMPIQQDIALHKHTEAGIADKWARGIADNDREMVKEAMEERNVWNKRNPETPIVITSSQLRSRLRQLATEKGGRVLKQTPKEMRGRVAQELAE
jgi:hypothetical protein